MQYVAHSDDRESSRGHGTHVAGTIAGQTLHCQRRHQKSNGIAMGAKLAIFDMGVAGSSLLDPPDDLADMFAAAKIAGARIHVNSWGTYPSGRNLYYSSWDLQVDSYLHENNVCYLRCHFSVYKRTGFVDVALTTPCCRISPRFSQLGTVANTSPSDATVFPRSQA